jgi:transposase
MARKDGQRTLRNRLSLRHAARLSPLQLVANMIYTHLEGILA